MMHLSIHNYDPMFKINLQAIIAPINGVLTSYYRWFVLMVVVLVGAGGWMFLLQGEYQHIVDSGILEYNNRVQQREDRQATLQSLEQLAKDFDNLNEERLDQLASVVPTGLDTIETVNAMQAFAASSNVNILSIDVVKESVAPTVTTGTGSKKNTNTTTTTTTQFSDDTIRTAVISMNVETPTASYAELKTFLDSLESFVPLLNLSNLTYAPDTTSFALQLETYYFDDTTQQ